MKVGRVREWDKDKENHRLQEIEATSSSSRCSQAESFIWRHGSFGGFRCGHRMRWRIRKEKERRSFPPQDLLMSRSRNRSTHYFLCLFIALHEFHLQPPSSPPSPAVLLCLYNCLLLRLDKQASAACAEMTPLRGMSVCSSSRLDGSVRERERRESRVQISHTRSHAEYSGRETGLHTGTSTGASNVPDAVYHVLLSTCDT